MKKTRFVRALEIFPGAVTWIALIAPIFLAIYFPAIIAMYVIVFDLYWLYKSVIMGFHLIYGYRLLQRDMKVDWIEKCKNLKEDPINLDWRDIYQAVIYAVSKESLETVMSSVESLTEADFP